MSTRALPDPLDVGVAAAACEHIRVGIVTGRLAPGERLVERSVATELGISSIAVRDAFARLELDGYIERAVRRGVRVRVLTEREVHETCEVRGILEGEAAARAAVVLAEGADGSALDAHVDGMADAAVRRDRNELVRLDDAFHAEIAALGGQAAMAEVLRGLRARATALVRRSLDLIDDDALDRMAPWHGALADALRSGDAELARAAARAHIELTRERVASALHDHLGNGSER